MYSTIRVYRDYFEVEDAVLQAHACCGLSQSEHQNLRQTLALHQLWVRMAGNLEMEWQLLAIADDQHVSSIRRRSSKNGNEHSRGETCFSKDCER